MKTSIFSFGLSVMILSFISSCKNNDDSKNKISITFDDVVGYMDPNTSARLVLENAHSGSTCTFVSKDQMYGLTYRRLISEISNTPFKKIKVSAWVRRDASSANLKLVCAVEKGNENVFWGSFETKSKALQLGTWEQVNAEFDVKLFYNGSYSLAIYPVNDGIDRILLDDLTIEFVN